MRITSLTLRDLRRYRETRARPRARADDRPRPERGGQVHAPARDRARAHPQGDERRGRARRPRAVGWRAGRPHVIDDGVHLRGRGRRQPRRPAREVVPGGQGHGDAWTSTARSSRIRPARTSSSPSCRACRPRASSARRPRSATTSSPPSSGTKARCGTGSRPRSAARIAGRAAPARSSSGRSTTSRRRGRRTPGASRPPRTPSPTSPRSSRPARTSSGASSGTGTRSPSRASAAPRPTRP